MSSFESAKFEVEKIIGKKDTPAGPEYLVKWKGFRQSESTWEPASNLAKLRDLIVEFEATGKKRRGRPPRASREKVEEKPQPLSREESLFCEVESRPELPPPRLPDTDEETQDVRVEGVRVASALPKLTSALKLRRSALSTKALDSSPASPHLALAVECHFRLHGEPVFKLSFPPDAAERDDSLYPMEQLQRERPDLLFDYLRRLILN